MDETLVRAAVDISGRPFLFFDARLSPSPLLSKPQAAANAATADPSVLYEFQTDTVEDFWQGFVNSAGCNLHLGIIRGRSDHHKIEALFKAAARALRAACEIDERARDIVPSTKGSLNPPGFNDGPWVLA
jgi:imidazoleglycerol-phosphate dehydratase